MASDRGFVLGFYNLFFFLLLVLSLEETLGGKEMKGVAMLGNELASVFFLRNGYYLSP